MSVEEALQDLIYTAGRVSIKLPLLEAEELSCSINQATNALQRAEGRLGGGVEHDRATG